jgi:hypothetical protein
MYFIFNLSFQNLVFNIYCSATQIDAFAQQQPGLETHLKNLNHGFTKYLERHTEIYEHDMQRVGDLFTKLHVVVQVDLTTPGNCQIEIVFFFFQFMIVFR